MLRVGDRLQLDGRADPVRQASLVKIRGAEASRTTQAYTNPVMDFGCDQARNGSKVGPGAGCKKVLAWDASALRPGALAQAFC